MICSHHVDHSAILQAQPHLWSLNICFTLARQHSNQQHNLKPYPFLATRRGCSRRPKYVTILCGLLTENMTRQDDTPSLA
jgi:hypothetical protein